MKLSQKLDTKTDFGRSRGKNAHENAGMFPWEKRGLIPRL